MSAYYAGEAAGNKTKTSRLCGAYSLLVMVAEADDINKIGKGNMDFGGVLPILDRVAREGITEK